MTMDYAHCTPATTLAAIQAAQAERRQAEAEIGCPITNDGVVLPVACSVRQVILWPFGQSRLALDRRNDLALILDDIIAEYGYPEVQLALQKWVAADTGGAA
jgi:hypothetical protein